MTLADEIADKTMKLAEGANMAFIVVTAENGSTRSYAISVIRMQGDPLVGGSPQTGDPFPAGVAVIMICSAGVVLAMLGKRQNQNIQGSFCQIFTNI